MTIFAIISLALTAISLAVWNGYLRGDITKADSARDQANKNLNKLADEYNNYRNRMENQLDVLHAELEDLSTQLVNCDSPDARRALLQRMLQAPGGTSN